MIPPTDLIMILVVSCTPSCLHRCRLPLSPLGVPTTPKRSAPYRRYPCWPHSGVYHSPKWQPDTINGARLIPTRCNNVLPTSPGPHTHMKPVGLALPPLPVLASYSRTQHACPILDLGRAHKDTFGILVEMGPHKLLLKLVV